MPNASLCFLSLCLAGAALVIGLKAASAQRWHLAASLPLIALGGYGVYFFWPSLLAVQKWITALVLPTGVVWLSLFAMALYAYHRGQRILAIVATGAWLLLSLAGNHAVGSRLLAALEGDFQHIDALATSDEPFDVIVTLGGGITRSPGGQVMLTGAGDRVALAARLYHAGRVRLLVATGEANAEILGPGRHPAQETQTFWQQLGVPADQILLLPGRNTKEELEHLKELSEQHNWQRIGLITSAWHMRRATGLAQSVSIKVEPLPADFLGDVPEWRLFHLVPNARALADTSRALKEYLARLVGR